MSFLRYAIYYLPPPEAAWTRFGTAWLGWDMDAASAVDHPELPDLPARIDEITAAPRKYGLHATLKPPFRLAAGTTEQDLSDAVETLAARCEPLSVEGLTLTRLGRFLALCPDGPDAALNALAAACVRQLDHFRAPLTPAELDRRRMSRLTPAQDANLVRWGYPFVMETYRFHITLTGRLPDRTRAAVQSVLTDALTPLLPRPLPITQIALVGERRDGGFQTLKRFPLGARPTR